MSGWLDDTALSAIPGAVAGGLVAGSLLPLLGMWVVLQRVVFLGVTLAQVAAAGVALGLVLDLPSLPFGMLITLGVVSLANSRKQMARLGDASLGAGFCVASALALLFISRSAADLDEVRHVLHGNLIYATSGAVWTVALTLLTGVTLIGLCFKEVLFSAFDAETATALGLAARRWQLLLFLVLAVALSVSMRTTGSLLSFAMLILPPLAALRLRTGLRSAFVLSGALGGLGTLGGLALAVSADLHVESSITLVLFLLIPVCAAWHWKPIAGLALAALLVAGGQGLQPAQVEDDHLHHHDAPAVAEPFHADVHLEASQSVDGGPVRVEWRASVHTEQDDPALPAALWLVVSGETLFDEHVLVPKLQDLPTGDSAHSGTFLAEADATLHRLEGQLWSGPTASMDSEPLDPRHAAVEGCDVVRR